MVVVAVEVFVYLQIRPREIDVATLRNNRRMGELEIRPITISYHLSVRVLRDELQRCPAGRLIDPFLYRQSQIPTI